MRLCALYAVSEAGGALRVDVLGCKCKCFYDHAHSKQCLTWCIKGVSVPPIIRYKGDVPASCLSAREKAYTSVK